ncbi:hypothetical protein C1H46_002201 [Malus baccata]|uniref:Uncharacterized protein n=1 Tax=Malus baccata TaxID=106549 RepID=A0A540NM74_MALBA|nr:hypothetical protein C1H46_002201 [Malus baccata]
MAVEVLSPKDCLKDSLLRQSVTNFNQNPNPSYLKHPSRPQPDCKNRRPNRPNNLPRLAVVNPENTFFSVKRLIGMRMSEVDEESKHVSYKVVKDANGNVKINCPAVVDFMVEILYASATFQISGVNLIDIYCLFNRARGTKLISLEDLLQACSL